MNRSYYKNTIEKFINEDRNSILGQLAKNHNHNLEELQKKAWLKQIDFLKKNLKDIEGHIYFEFSIPRMGKRVDNIIISENFIFVIEFKVGEREYPIHAQYQAIDYCLDLMNFHEGSHDKVIIPVLVATQAPKVENNFEDIKNLHNCLLCNSDNFENTIVLFLSTQTNNSKINIKKWEGAAYKPTPTIIEAAQALYKGHSVDEISRSDAGAINLSKTTAVINDIIDEAKEKKKKTICFLTGVPGAGKTLAGLNIAIERLKVDKAEHSVFLSGNGPLVNVLREALARDSVVNKKGTKLTLSNTRRNAKTFIQNIHHFRDEYLKVTEAPVEKVVVFDEAQRAWQKEQVSKFMKNKKGIEDFEMSEPEYLISVMDRHKDWCTIICLIGGGQEINTGEAGLSEWIEALRYKYHNWNIFYSDKILTETQTYINDNNLSTWLKKEGNKEADLHLSTSIRSFRSEKAPLLVQLILENKGEEARSLFDSIKDSYPIYLTRDLTKAKKWLKESAKGTERIGIIGNSGGKRLRAEGIDVKMKLNLQIGF